MPNIGFSTGSLSLGRVAAALHMLLGKNIAAVELSALRAAELPALAAAVDRLRLEQYSYVSVHAPSNWDTLTEAEGIEFLAVFAAKNWPIVLHPDCIENYGAWRVFGSLLLIENMDKRKLVGRTAAELETVFDQLPEAGLCFDIGHAHQVDPTMAEAFHILRQFGRR